LSEFHRHDPASVIVFLGPTLSHPEAAELLGATFHPPARRGDVHRALRDQCRTIVLIDGEFHGRPSVWQREILDALAEGVTVHGSSSMGALRAAELDSFGMIGHGRIFEWYRDGVIDADDEVALTYGPGELGYPSLSEPLVNIRATLAAAVPSLISVDERNRLIAHVKALYFPERSFTRLLDTGPATEWRVDRRVALASFLRQSRIDQKRCDAIAALRSVAADPNRRHGGTSDVPTKVLWRRERVVAEGLAPDMDATDPAVIVRNAGLAPTAVGDLRRKLSELYFVAMWARTSEIVAEAEDFAQARRELAPAGDLSEPRVRLLLETRATACAAIRTVSATRRACDPKAARRIIILDWIQANGIEHAGLSGDALIDWVIAVGPNGFGYVWPFAVELIDALRLQGWAGATPAEVPS
jgi:hypothetical protein